MSEYLPHPTDENLRIKIEQDPYPSKPYNDGGFPIWRMEPSRNYTGYDANQETDITGYVTPILLDDRLSDLTRERGKDDAYIERYLRIFWGATFVQTWHSGSFWYLTADPAHWREHVGITDADTQREGYAEHAFTEWQAWVEGDVWFAVEQQRVQREVKTHTIYPDGTTDDDFICREDWEDTETGAVGGFYGDVDQDMAANMAWQFGWPEATDSHEAEQVESSTSFYDERGLSREERRRHHGDEYNEQED